GEVAATEIPTLYDLGAALAIAVEGPVIVAHVGSRHDAGLRVVAQVGQNLGARHPKPHHAGAQLSRHMLLHQSALYRHRRTRGSISAISTRPLAPDREVAGGNQ